MPASLLPAGILYYSDFRELTTSAAKMIAKPTIIIPVNLSPNTRQDASAPNTDSSDKRIAAWEDGAMLWPMFCRLMAMVVEKTARYKRPPAVLISIVTGMPLSKIRE